MNKTVLIIGVVVVLFLAGAGGFMFMNRAQNAPQATTQEVTPSEASPTTANTMEKKSLKDLMGIANNQECKFSDVESKTSGVTYISGGKVRGDFSSTANGTTISSHMLSDGKNLYVWMDGQKSGFKTSIEKMESMQQNTQTETMDVNKQVDYECKNWSADQSKFQTPSGVTFNDISSMIPSGLMTTGTKVTGTQDLKSVQCVACESLPEAAQAQCKAALKC